MGNGSLGAMLRQSQENAEANKLAMLEKEAKQQSAEAKKAFDTVVRFFEEAKRFFTDDISAGEIPKGFMLGYRYNQEASSVLCTYQWNDPSARIDNNPRHKYRPVWDDFVTWATENELVPELEYAHDGVGMESWHVLSVKPKPV